MTEPIPNTDKPNPDSELIALIGEFTVSRSSDRKLELARQILGLPATTIQNVRAKTSVVITVMGIPGRPEDLDDTALLRSLVRDIAGGHADAPAERFVEELAQGRYEPRAPQEYDAENLDTVRNAGVTAFLMLSRTADELDADVRGVETPDKLLTSMRSGANLVRALAHDIDIAAYRLSCAVARVATEAARERDRLSDAGTIGRQ